MGRYYGQVSTALATTSDCLILVAAGPVMALMGLLKVVMVWSRLFGGECSDGCAIAWLCGRKRGCVSMSDSVYCT